MLYWDHIGSLFPYSLVRTSKQCTASASGRVPDIKTMISAAHHSCMLV